MTTVTDCRCDDLEFVDADASLYARGHFLLETVGPDALSATWICPATGWRWRETYFSAWRSDEAAARLDRLEHTSAQPAERRARIPWRPALASLATGLALTTLLELVVL